jgi:hypothetical protein
MQKQLGSSFVSFWKGLIQMQQRLRRLLVVAVLFAGYFPWCSSQELDALSQYTLSAADGKVIIEWTIAKGNTCQGVGIYRSADSTLFEQIGEISGICGSNETSVSYSFVDEAPVANAINYYRLSLGFLGESAVLSITVIDLGNTKVQIWPNPMGDAGQIVFKNDQNEKHRLMVYQTDGRFLFDQLSSQAYFPLNLTAYPTGVYLFTISEHKSGQLVARGKLMRQ